MSDFAFISRKNHFYLSRAPQLPANALIMENLGSLSEMALDLKNLGSLSEWHWT